MLFKLTRFRDFKPLGKEDRRRTRGSRGFSLVEVAMAVAITGFACVSLMGMLSMGLTSFHQAVGQTIEAQIAQNLSNDLVLANFSDLYQYTYTYGNKQTYYYDNEGQPLATGSGGSAPPAGAIYTAVVSLSVVNSSVSPVALNGTSVSTAGAPTPATIPTISSAYNVSITITNITKPGKSNVYSVVVANNNQ